MALGIIADGAISGMNPTICSSMSPTRVDLASPVMVVLPTFSSLNPLLGSVVCGCHVSSITSLNWVFRRWHFIWPQHLSISNFSSWLPRVQSETHVNWLVKLIVDWIWVLAFGVSLQAGFVVAVEERGECFCGFVFFFCILY